MSWIGTAVVGGLTLGAVGTGISATSKDKVSNEWLANPEYPNSQEARDTWWKKLQTWGEDPNYGAISPDWNTIWEQTQQKVKQYYNGSPMAPGVQQKISSSLARRGMSENPASDFLHAQVEAQEAQDLGNLSAQQNISQNQFSETGRQNWLSSLQNFQAQKPSGQWNTTVSNQGAQIGNALSQIGGAVGSAGVSAYGNQQQLASLDKFNNAGMSYSPSIDKWFL